MDEMDGGAVPAPRKRLALVDDWREWHRMASVRMAAIGAAISAGAPAIASEIPQAWAMVPPDLRGVLPHHFQQGVAYACFFLALIAFRLTQRKDTK